MISEVLLRGKQNAITTDELAAVFNVQPRYITRAVNVERLAGKPICSSNDISHPGYYLAANKEEMRSFCEQLRHRAGEIFRTRRACLRSIEKLEE